MGTFEVGLNVFSLCYGQVWPHRLMYLNTPMGSRERNAVVGICLSHGKGKLGSVVLLEEVCQSRVGFEVLCSDSAQCRRATPPTAGRRVSCYLLPLGPCLPGCCHDDNVKP